VKTDVCLVLEGTYPYVAGGVSTWVAQILQHMPHLRFSILYIGPSRDAPRSPKYAIPPNVAEIREVFVHDYPEPSRRPAGTSPLSREDWQVIERFQHDVGEGRSADVMAVSRVVEKLPTAEAFMDVMARSPQAWEAIVKTYEAAAPEGVSFLDYFWIHRFINLPALKLLTSPLPNARLYHAASTGYAGLLAAKARAATGAPLILTEHGLYTRERRIEIYSAEWIEDSAAEAFLDLRRSQSYFKDWWTRFFLGLSRTAYEAADVITTLFEANRWVQLRDGAPQERTRLIPNGIDTAAFGRMTPRVRSEGDPLRIGFVGRVTAIKDVKTLLRALATLRGRNVPFEALIMGPTDEEAEYAEECRELAGSLDLHEQVRFLGRVDVTRYYEELDVVVLTSISEAQPFVILEANCAGLPVVATAVGACPELLEGRTPPDRALGPSGLLTPVASPVATADALERLARSPDLARRMGQAGRERVTTYYDLANVMNEYLDLYETLLYAGRPEGRRLRPASAAGTGA